MEKAKLLARRDPPGESAFSVISGPIFSIPDLTDRLGGSI